MNLTSQDITSIRLSNQAQQDLLSLNAITLRQCPAYREGIKASDANIDPQVGKVSDWPVYAVLKKRSGHCLQFI